VSGWSVEVEEEDEEGGGEEQAGVKQEHRPGKKHTLKLLTKSNQL